MMTSRRNCLCPRGVQSYVVLPGNFRSLTVESKFIIRRKGILETKVDGIRTRGTSILKRCPNPRSFHSIAQGITMLKDPSPAIT